jgi:hypothetical protein
LESKTITGKEAARIATACDTHTFLRSLGTWVFIVSKCRSPHYMKQFCRLHESSDSYSLACASNACHHLAACSFERRKPLKVAALVNGYVRCLYPYQIHNEQWILPPEDEPFSVRLKPVSAKVSGTKLAKQIVLPSISRSILWCLTKS